MAPARMTSRGGWTTRYQKPCRSGSRIVIRYGWTIAQTSLIHVEHACYFAAGLLFWWPALQNEPHRLSGGARAVYLFAAFVLASPLGLLLALIPTAVYHFYVHAPRLWGLSPLADQQIGGAAMALEQAAVLFAGSTYFFLRFLGGDERAEAYRALGRSS